jgi:hypothetical protein
MKLQIIVCKVVYLSSLKKELESRFEICFELIYIWNLKKAYDHVEDDNKLVKFSDKRHGECEEGTKEITQIKKWS